MFGLGFSEMLLVMVVALVAIGPKKLPGVAKAMGRGIAEFRNAMDEMRTTVYKQVQQPIEKAINQPELKETSAEYLDRLLAEREKERAETAAKADAAYGIPPDATTDTAENKAEGGAPEAAAEKTGGEAEKA